MEDGTCQECPTFTKLLDSKRDCAAEECNYDQKVNIKGKCEDCLSYYATDPEDKTNCKLKKCEPNQKVTEEAKCVTCPEYQRA